MNDVDFLPLILTQVAVASEQLGVAKDRIHGRADLVRHIGQEGALRPVGAFRGLLRGAQLVGAAGDQRFKTLPVLAQLEVRDQHLGEQVERGALLEQERAFGGRRAFLQIHDLDEPPALADRE